MEGTEEPSGGSPLWAKITGIQFGLMTRKNILKLSVAENPEDSVKPKDLMNANLGLPTADGKCLTCNGITVDQCQGHFGHIPLSVPIFHPNHVETLVRLLRKICLSCGQLRKKHRSPTQEPCLPLPDPHKEDIESDSRDGSKKRKKSSTFDSECAHKGLSSMADAKNRNRVEDAVDEDVEDWSEATKQSVWPKNLIVLSSDDSDEELVPKTKLVPEDARSLISQAAAEIPSNSSRNTRKRKLTRDLNELSSKSASKVVAICAPDSHKTPGKFTEIAGQPKKAGKFGDKYKSTQQKDNYCSPKVCKYCSASSRRLGYPEPEIRIQVTSRGTSSYEDSLSFVKVIQMRVNPSDKVNLAPDFWEFVEGSSKAENTKGSRYLLPSEALKIVKKIPKKNIAGLGMKANVASPKALIVQCIPIPPNCTRLQEDAFASNCNIGFKMGVDRATQAFAKLLRRINSLKVSRFSKPVFQAALMECSVLQALFEQYLREKGAPKAAPGKEKKRIDQSGRLQKRASRWSLDWLKSNIIGKRSAFSARNVVTGDPFLSVEEVGVPLAIAKHVTCPERVTTFNRSILQTYIDIGQSLGDSRACGAVRILKNGERREVTRKTAIELEVGDIVHRHLKDGDLVFINRPPSLHKHSLLALKARVHTEATWTINPAICSPLHADFDGDCLHLFVPQTEESRAELHQLMTLPAQILPSPNESTIMGLSQDYILAAYLVTSSPVFLTKEEMHQLRLWAVKEVPAPTIVKSPKGVPLWTGKQVIDLTIPENLSFKSINNGTVIQNGEILSCGEKPSWLASTKGLVRIVALDNAEAAIKHLDCSQSVLREWLLIHGFSVSLEDFYAAPDQYQRRRMKQEMEDSLEYAKCMAIGKQFVFDKKFQKDILFRPRSTFDPAAAAKITGMRHDLEDIAITCFRQSQSEIVETMANSIAHSNRLLAMVRSGSKGSTAKVMQQTGSLGIQVVNGDKLLSPEKIPKLVALAAAMGYASDSEMQEVWETRGLVKSSLLDGLEPHEFFTHAISVRDGIFRQSQEIAGPGELFKRLMLFLRDVHFAYDGTVRNRGGMEVIQFQYEGTEPQALPEENTSASMSESGTVMPGDAVGILAATAISQPAYQIMLDASPGIGSRKIRPLDLLQESMFPRSKAELKAWDRISILRLSRCACEDKYCGERRILHLQAELQPVTVEMFVSHTAIEYAFESWKRWDSYDFVAKEIKETQLLPWIGHIQLDKMHLIEKKITPARILSVLEANVKVIKYMSRKYHLIFCLREIGDHCGLVTNESLEKAPRKMENATCLHFSLFRGGRTKRRNLKTTRQLADDTAEILNIARSAIIPLILKTVVKGFEKIESARIVWENEAWSLPRIMVENNSFVDKLDGELVLEVTVKNLYCNRSSRGMPWKVVQESCLPVMDYVDWQRSSPYSIQEIKSIFGVDAAQDVLIQRFGLAAGDHVVKKHLKLVADLMAHSGEIHGLTSYGYRDWMRSLKIPTPFTEGVFRAPMKHFMDAGRKGVFEKFTGVLASSVFGKKVPVGTGADFQVNLKFKPQFKHRLPSKMDSGCSSQGEPGQSDDILECLIDVNSDIAAEYPPVTLSSDRSKAFEPAQMERGWGSAASIPISEPEGGWGAADDGSKSIRTVTTGSWGFDREDRNPTGAWGTNTKGNSQRGSPNCVTTSGGGWEDASEKSPKGASGSWVEEKEAQTDPAWGSNIKSDWVSQNVETALEGAWGCPEAETSNPTGTWGF